MFPLNVPNVLTMLRILAVPVIVVALLDETPNGDALAAAVFALAAATDGLDGYIARSRGSVTTFGKLMDPLADKLRVAAAPAPPRLLQADGAAGRQAARGGGPGRARLPRSPGRLGGDGDHRARVRRHGAAGD